MNSLRICISCLVAGLLVSTGVEAASFSFSSSNGPSKNYRTTSNRPWGNLETFKPGLKSEPPPAISGGPQYYLGAAPGTGWYPTQMSGIEKPAAVKPPVVEVETSGAVFYEQQNIVYTVRVVSSDNLKTLTPVIPRIKGAVLEQVDGPVATTRKSWQDSSREIVNEYRFKLTPLRSGEIVVPPIEFTGTHVSNRQWNGAPGRPANGSGKSFSIAADGPLVLQTLPADPFVTPWLPLNDLKLRVQMPDNGPAKAGVPITLTLELTARGALGTQLPSLEQQLKSDGFRAYRDSVTTSSGVSSDGTKFLGSRKETYTIIPLQDGWIHLPGIQVAWWDVDTDKPMVAGLPGHDAVAGTAGTSNTVAASGEQGLFAAYFWAPLLIVMGLIVGYWLGAWARTRPFFASAGSRAGNWLTASGQQVMHYTRAAGKTLSPMPYLDKVRMGFAFFMPKSVKLWLCVRCIEREDRPEAWCNEFRSRVCKQLDISSHAPISVVAEKIIQQQPLAEPARLRTLVQTMDNALYGAGSVDFAAWKKDLRQQLRPRLYQRRRSTLRRARRALPVLNPRVA
jgi:hypothetical protein